MHPEVVMFGDGPLITSCLRHSKFYPMVTSEFIEGTLWSKSGHGPSVTDGAVVLWKLPVQRGLMRSGCSGLCWVPSEHLQPWRFHHGLAGHSQAAASLQTPPRPALKSCFLAAQCPNRVRWKQLFISNCHLLWWYCLHTYSYLLKIQKLSLF